MICSSWHFAIFLIFLRLVTSYSRDLVLLCLELLFFLANFLISFEFSFSLFRCSASHQEHLVRHLVHRGAHSERIARGRVCSGTRRAAALCSGSQPRPLRSASRLLLSSVALPLLPSSAAPSSRSRLPLSLVSAEEEKRTSDSRWWGKNISFEKKKRPHSCLFL